MEMNILEIGLDLGIIVDALYQNEEGYNEMYDEMY